MASEKRKVLFIDKPLQMFLLKLIAGSCVLCAFAVLFSSFAFFYSIRDLYVRTENPMILQIVNLINEYLWIYYIYVGTSIVLCAMVITYAWLVISNRFAGPAYRIRSHIDEYLQGGKFQQIKLRENDSLKNLAESVNELVKKISPQDFNAHTPNTETVSVNSENGSAINETTKSP